MEVINLNLIPSGALPVVHASQYDEGRTFRANLMDGSTVYTLDGTEVLECDVKKPDGNIVTVAVTNTSDSYVEIDTTLQMCACAGESLAELHITKGAQEIGTLNFILAVERSPLEGGIQSDSGIHNLQTQIGEAVADQYAAEDVVFDAAPTAGHGVGFAVTSEGVKTADDAVAALIPKDLDDLSDVTYTGTPAMGEAVVWDGSKWTNGTPDMDVSDLADVTITTPSDDDILVYQNGEWVNMANPASTANFGADYDENTTYNTGDKCVYNNLLYECNDDGVTGAWDGSKWDSLTVASMTDNNLPHYTGTPTQGTTAYEIANVVNAIPYVKYEEKNIALDATGEGTLFTSNVYVVGIKDIPSDSLYVGYAVYFAGTQTKVKAISRSALAFTSQGVVSQTRKIGIYYLDNISTT